MHTAVAIGMEISTIAWAVGGGAKVEGPSFATEDIEAIDDTPLTAESPDDTYTADPDGEKLYQVLHVLDTPPTVAGDTIDWLTLSEDLEVSDIAGDTIDRDTLFEYLEASRMIGRASLGKIEIDFRSRGVAMPGISETMCAISDTGNRPAWFAAFSDRDEKAAWFAALDEIRKESLAAVKEQTFPVTDYDGTIIDFTATEVCYPGGEHTANGYKSKVYGIGSYDGPMYIFKPGVPTKAHETGHNLGFGHADKQVCGESEEESTVCVTEEYGDTSSVMGRGNGGRDGLSGFAMAIVGAIKPNQIIEVPPGTNTYELQALLNPSSGPKLLHIKLENEKEGLYVELSAVPIQISMTEKCKAPGYLPYERPPDCVPHVVGVHIMTGPKLTEDTRTQLSHTTVMDLIEGDDPDTHAGKEDEGEVPIFEDQGIEIRLRDLVSSPDRNGTGTAVLEMTVPR